MSDTDEIAGLYARYRSGALTRADLLEEIAKIIGAATAASMLTTLESQDTSGTPEQALITSIQEMSDRLEIQSNVWDYANAIDLQAWDMLDDVFMPDAEITYGGVLLKGPAIKDWF